MQPVKFVNRKILFYIKEKQHYMRDGTIRIFFSTRKMPAYWRLIKGRLKIIQYSHLPLAVK